MKSLISIARFSLYLILPLFTGCSAALNPYHESFNCRTPDDSGHCIDTPSAYEEAVEVGSNPLVKEQQVNPANNVNEARLTRLTELLHEPQTPMIAPPRILRVLILPYKGNGDLFMARYAYLQVESANWVLTGIDEDIEP